MRCTRVRPPLHGSVTRQRSRRSVWPKPAATEYDRHSRLDVVLRQGGLHEPGEPRPLRLSDRIERSLRRSATERTTDRKPSVGAASCRLWRSRHEIVPLTSTI